MANNLEEPVSYYIPMVLFYDILSRLPVKSLIRFQTVCKAWYRLIIENPNFIQTHNSMQSTLQHKPSFTAMVLKIGNRMKIRYSDDTFHMLFDFQLPNLFMHNFHVVGICDGLFCATESSHSSEYIIFNPTTRKLRKICPFKLPVFEHDVFYLWFGVFENKYKLLKLNYTWLTEDPIIRGELYCLCSDSWQEIEVNLGESVPIFHSGYHLGPNPRQPLMLDGVLFWKDDYSDVNSCVAYFDMRKMVFDVIALPFDRYDCKRGWELLEVNHKLSLVSNEEGSHIEFWLLDENMKSFTKIHKVSCLTCSGYPPNCDGISCLLGCSRKGEVFIEDNHKKNSMLLLYDLDSNQMKYLHDTDFEWECRGPSWKYGSVYPYNASLTRVD